MHKFTVILLLINLAFVVANAQLVSTVANADSSILITSDTRLAGLIKRQTDANRLKQTVPGFRIQIYFGVNRPKASEIKLEFMQKNFVVPCYLTYQQPYYKVRVGDFRNRLEATKFMNEIQSSYVTCFIVPDEVNWKK